MSAQIPLPSRPASLRGACWSGPMLALLGVLAIGTGATAQAPAPSTPPRASESGITIAELITEAARRFAVPERWIAEIMQVESGGRATAVSPKGAIGLMQVMPETYAGIAARHGLGVNPRNPRDNVMAGAAYLREMYDRYGPAGMLAAYNAGPGRWEDYLSRARPLPDETVRYLARLGPVVGTSLAPLPAFTGRTVARMPMVAPIFVALGPAPLAVQGATERERIVRIIVANGTVLGRPAAIFVPRSHAADTLPREPHGDEETGNGVQPSRPRSEAPAASTPPSNPLFAPRTGSGEGP